jgi:hypothetical protein
MESEFFKFALVSNWTKRRWIEQRDVATVIAAFRPHVFFSLEPAYSIATDAERAWAANATEDMLATNFYYKKTARIIAAPGDETANRVNTPTVAKVSRWICGADRCQFSMTAANQLTNIVHSQYGVRLCFTLGLGFPDLMVSFTSIDADNYKRLIVAATSLDGQ